MLISNELIVRFSDILDECLSMYSEAFCVAVLLLPLLWFIKRWPLYSTHAAAPLLLSPWLSANLPFYTLHWDQTWHQSFPSQKHLLWIYSRWQDRSSLPTTPALTHRWSSRFDGIPKIMSRQKCEIMRRKWDFLTIRKHSIRLFSMMLG